MKNLKLNLKGYGRVAISLLATFLLFTLGVGQIWG